MKKIIFLAISIVAVINLICLNVLASDIDINKYHSPSDKVLNNCDSVGSVISYHSVTLSEFRLEGNSSVMISANDYVISSIVYFWGANYNASNLKNSKLAYFVYIPDKDNLNNITAELWTGNGEDIFWSVDISKFENGWNYIQLSITNSTYNYISDYTANVSSISITCSFSDNVENYILLDDFRFTNIIIDKTANVTFNDYIEVFALGVFGGFSVSCVVSLLGYGIYQSIKLMKGA